MLKRFRPIAAAIALIVGVLTEQSAVAQEQPPSGPLAARLISAPLVSPATAWANYGPSTIHSNGVAAWSGLPPEMQALARSLGNSSNVSNSTYVANVFEYVRNNIDTEFRFGLGKGGRGALIDQSGTAFDQAELMVKLLRAKGIAANYHLGTITLTAQQFGTWTGLVTSYNAITQAVTVDAAAACQLLADGGVPGACTPTSGTLTSIQMGHIWVSANGMLYDPSFKPSTLYNAAVDVSAAMNCGTANASTCGTAMTSMATTGNGYVSGTTNIAIGNTTASVPYVQNLNEVQLNNWLQTSATAVQSQIQSINRLASVAQIVGGRELTVTPTPAGAASLAYASSPQAIWSADIPDQYRTKLWVRLGQYDQLFYADEIAGRRLQLTQDPGRVMQFDGTPLAPATCLPAPSCFVSDIVLAVDHPYPNSSYADETRAYMLATIGGDSNSFPAQGQYPVTIVHGFGNSGTLSERHYAALQELLPSAYSIAYELGGNPRWGVQMSFTNREQVMLATRVLSQSTIADRIISGLSKSLIQRHHALGVVYTEGLSPSTLNNMSIEPVSSVISATNDTSARRAAFETSASTFATLEGSANQQLNSTDTGVSLAAGFWSANTDLPGKRREKFVEMTNAQLSAVFGANNPVVADGFGAVFFLNNAAASFTSTLFVGANAVGHMYGGTKGAAVTTSDPYSRSMETAKVAEMAAARKKYLNISPVDGSATITETDLVTGAGEFPHALPFTRTYTSGVSVQETGSSFESYRFAQDSSEQVSSSSTYTLGYSGPDAAANSRIGGGWTHNYNVTATYTGDGAKALGQDYAIESAASITALRAIYDAARNPTLAGRVTSMLASYWMARYQWAYNSVVVNKGGSSESFQRLPDDSFFTATGSARLVQSGRQTLANDFSPVSFTYTGKGGDTIAFSVGRYSKTPVCCNAPTQGDPIFKADRWTFPDGTIVTFNYTLEHLISSGNAVEYQDMTCGSGSNCPPGSIHLPMGFVLSSVHNNHGRSLTFTNVNTKVQTFLQTPSGDDPQKLTSRFTITHVTDENGRFAQYSMVGCPSTSPWVCERLEVTAPDGGVSIYSYVPAADSPNPAVTGRGSYRLRRWFTPSDANNPYRVLTYDEMFRVAVVADPLDNLTRYYPGGIYGPERWKRSETVSAVGAVSVDYFDDHNNHVKNINPLGHTTLMAYDRANRKTSTTKPEGDRVEQTYDVRSNVLSTVRYAKPNSGWPTYTSSSTYGEGAAVRNCTNWKTCNKPLTATDGRSHTTTYTYSSATGQLLSETGPSVPLNGGNGNSFTRLCYSNVDGLSLLTGSIKRVNGSTNRVRAYAYNSLNRYVLQSVTDDPDVTLTAPSGDVLVCPTGSKSGALNLTTTLSFDRVGNLQSVDGPRTDVSDVTNYTFDQARRITRIAVPLGAVTRYCYDADGLLRGTHRSRVSNATDPNAGSVTVNGACGASYPAASWQSELRNYWSTGDLRTVEDAEGNVTRYAYDGAGQLRVVQDPERRQIATVYDLAGQVVATWRGGDKWIDGYGKPSADAPTEGTAWDPNSYIANTSPKKDLELRYAAYQYTPNGKRGIVQDANNNSTLYSYDGHDRLAVTRFPDAASGSHCSVASPLTPTTPVTCSGTATYERYTYDPNDNRETLRSRNGHTTTWMYDDANRIQTKAVSGGTPALPTVTYGYNLLNEPTALTSPALGTIPAHSTTYDYDGAGRKLFEENQLDQTRRVSYLYGDKANRTRTTWEGGYFVSYEYDALNRMTYARENGTNEVAHYEYDTLSRRSRLTFAAQTSNRIDYTYELDSNLDLLTNVLNTVTVTLDHGHNDAGQLNRIDASDYTYLPAATVPGATPYVADKLNRYSSVGDNTAPNAATYDNNGNLLTWYRDGQQQTYSYDAENRLRIAVSNGTSTSYDYDALGRRISKTVGSTTPTYYMLDGDEEIAEISAGAVQRRYIMGPAIDDRIARAESGAITNPTKTYYHVNHQGSVIATTQANGTLEQKISYDEFGKSSAASTGEPFRFTGRRLDPETGLYYYRARYYSPHLGRFLQTDPVGYDDDVNLYAYVGNDPLNATDPTGKFLFVIPVIGYGLTALESAVFVSTAVVAGVGAAAVINEAKSDNGNAPTPGARPSDAASGNKAGESTLKPGPYAGESIPARGPGRDFTPGEREKVNEIGKESGCHTCGSKDPGTKSGNFVPDHQPPSAANPNGEAQRLYPQCLNCSRTQGGEVRQLKPPPPPDPLKDRR